MGRGGAWVPAPGLLLPEGSLPSQRCRRLWALSLHTAPCPPLPSRAFILSAGPVLPTGGGLGLRAVAANSTHRPNPERVASRGPFSVLVVFLISPTIHACYRYLGNLEECRENKAHL